MRISSLFRRDNSPRARIEPTKLNVANRGTPGRSSVRQSHEGRAVADDDTVAHGVQEDLRGSNAVFGLIGTSALLDDIQAQRKVDGMAPAAEDLMASLYGQYCRVLDDPKASLAGEWSSRPMPSADDSAERPSPAVYAQTAPSSFESIETFLTGAYRMEHAFGPMGTGEAPELVSMEPVPEILRLFAPAGYEASVLRRPSALPPALARREHHSLGIDSPLSVPQSTTSHSDAS
jgi:hypothetical protein